MLLDIVPVSTVSQVYQTISFKKFFSFFFMFWPGHTACAFLVPWPRIEPESSAVQVQSLNHWIAREIPRHSSWKQKQSIYKIKICNKFFKLRFVQRKVHNNIILLFNSRMCLLFSMPYPIYSPWFPWDKLGNHDEMQTREGKEII